MLVGGGGGCMVVVVLRDAVLSGWGRCAVEW